MASGAALLFGTNLVAIILGAATVFRGIGVHANRNTAAANVWVRRAVGGLVLAALGLASWFMVHLPALVAGEGQTIQVTDGLHSALQRAVEADRGHRIVFVAPRRGAAELEVVIAAERESDEPGLQARLAAAAEAAVSRPVRVRLVVLEATRVLEPPE